MTVDNSEAIFAGHIEMAPDEIGTPTEDATYAPGPQERPDSCAIRSQQHILAMYGIDIPETELVRDAVAHHEYSIMDISGTSMEDVGNLLERNGIATQRYEGASMAHLISELGQGHKIIVGVDAFEIDAITPEQRLLEMQKDAVAQIPNHALVVVNVDPKTLEVDVVDPLDGQLHRVPPERFLDAWQDSNCFMVSTTKSPEEYFKDVAGAEASSPVVNTYNGGIVMNDMNMRGIDSDGDGVADIIEQDLNGDGVIDRLVVDANHDGIADVTIQAQPGLVNVTPSLGSLGHVSGAVADNGPALGSLGHVSGMVADSHPGLGGLGHLSGAVVNGSVPNLGGLGHASGEISSVEAWDLDGDGVADMVAMDTTGDGIVDTCAIDLDGDSVPDAFATGIDINGDGLIDGVAVDVDGDGIPDIVGIDIDGDGIIDQVINMDDL